MVGDRGSGPEREPVQVPTANDLMKKTETFNRDPLFMILPKYNILIIIRKYIIESG